MPDELAVRLGESMRRRRWTLAVAESCTGGRIGARITEIPGASDYFLGGVIAYSNEIKVGVLGVRTETLMTYGAVSEPTAQEMASGVRKVFSADIGLAVTGVAGPGGGTPEKPVGMIWLALETEEGVQSRLLRLQGDRAQNRAEAAEQALRLLDRIVRPGRRVSLAPVPAPAFARGNGGPVSDETGRNKEIPNADPRSDHGRRRTRFPQLQRPLPR
jgi:PncC family amidohydrolase